MDKKGNVVLFPAVTGSNLERRRFRLPGDLDGDLNWLILAFWQRHQGAVDTWMPLAKRLEERHSGFITYEVPVIQSRSRLSQWFIDSGMRAGIPDPQVRSRTITLYLAKAPFLEALEIETDDDICSVIVDRSGAVLWRTAGPWSAESETDLVAFLEDRSAP
jgi:hypothetical protein